MLLLAALMCGSASAQVVNKCMGKGGAVHYYSGPCPAGYQHAKTWDATPEQPPTNEELWRRYYQRKQGEADSRYLSGLAGTSSGAVGHRVRADGARSASACDAAKASRESTLAAVGMRRTYELLQQLDDSVREACK
ncbi:DUF4124 domain-containing protein [Lysobacter sp. MMG2]|uniref:DUF4124 domain-containing protein n=1 Tax=Lysobacter sp. MMG2 TaxID=2801338 RepID=UPI001C21A0A1|nr:DUF4124 domain-containing protein [Lysobacter sp. MMG2]MBU8974521.1 DUF4124 domain-containing protein [Lysobacter sp. MMG2]